MSLCHVVALERRRLMSSALLASRFDQFTVPSTPQRGAPRIAEITAGPDGNMWFTDPDAQTVGRITPRGVVTEFHVNEIGPRGIVAGPDGNIWVTAGEPFVSPAIIRITPSGQLTDFLIPNFHNQPEHITVGADGNLWFTEFVYPSSQAIGRMTPSGQLTEFPYQTPGFSSDPEGISAGRDGNLYFAHNGFLARITPSGQVSDQIGQAGLGLATGPDGNIWSVGTRYNTQTGQVIGGYVERSTLAGVATRFDLPSPDAWPQMITAGPDGNLWFTEPGINKIARITTAGKITEFTAPSPLSELGGIAAGPDGNIWFTELGSNHIARFVPNRTLTAATSLGSVGTSFVNDASSATFQTDRLINSIES